MTGTAETEKTEVQEPNYGFVDENTPIGRELIMESGMESEKGKSWTTYLQN